MNDRPAHRRLCVLLLQLGGPQTLPELESYLYNLYEDILPGPAAVRRPLARIFARRRASELVPQSAAQSGSRLLRETETQADALRNTLEALGWEAQVFVCMRYSSPHAIDGIEAARRDWNDATWIALPLHPQYSFTTTGTSMDELQDLLTEAELARLLHIRAYPADPLYLDAVSECVQHGLEQFANEQRDDVHIVFAAHGLPVRLVRKGDPFPEHLERTVAGTLERIGELPHTIAYQGNLRPLRCLEPSVENALQALGRAGAERVLVVPVSSVAEHVETLQDLDVRMRSVAEQAGIREFVRAPTLDSSPKFIEALAQQILRALPHSKDELQRPPAAAPGAPQDG